ncbi:hypothetical protein [Allopseudospirillum japonicum]|nr:hypothetical protein [Allopseudospirillum japonicum]
MRTNFLSAWACLLICLFVAAISQASSLEIYRAQALPAAALAQALAPHLGQVQLSQQGQNLILSGDPQAVAPLLDLLARLDQVPASYRLYFSYGLRDLTRNVQMYTTQQNQVFSVEVAPGTPAQVQQDFIFAQHRYFYRMTRGFQVDITPLDEYVQVDFIGQVQAYGQENTPAPYEKDQAISGPQEVASRFRLRLGQWQKVAHLGQTTQAGQQDTPSVTTYGTQKTYGQAYFLCIQALTENAPQCHF